ncbi:MAG: DUF1735 domain-containing protein [Candidatus Pseudobacter hemicellulosilyticus]|uniref:DUF1735 domain-containing protein n=1 Tax=Candidatus Pseudobacter hemicellulosilyticus TaxID=3121375 RepID=A0AAJ5WTI3_9BACT|nr:MAG: DUF1735 domain-containing protein [Pseudobacter sp.]
MTTQLIKALLITTGVAVSFVSCYKDTEYTSQQEGTIYVPQAYGTKASLTLYKLDSVQTRYFGIAYGGFNAAGSDITATFEIDSSLIDAYNTKNYTNYVTLPRAAFSVPELTTILKAGKTSSEGLNIDIQTSSLKVGTKYMLPIKLVSTTPGSFNSDMSVAYFRIDSLTQRMRDVTLPATITVSKENANGSSYKEGSPKLIDGDTTTKFYSPGFTANSLWMALQLSEARTIHAYSLTTGNDEASRDPKTWELQGSDDGATWKTLDTRTDYLFSGRRQMVNFELTNGDGHAYLHYRLFVNYNNGNAGFQLSEWRLLQYY